MLLLDSAFKGLIEKTQAQFSEEFGELGLRLWRERVSGDVEKYFLSRFTAAGLAALAQHGSKADLARARVYLKEGNHLLVRAQALEILVRFGGKSDVPAILTFADQCYGRYKERCFEAAMRLASGPDGAFKKILERQDEIGIKVALRMADKVTVEAYEETVKSLLVSEKGLIREIAVAHYVSTSSNDQLVGLLEEYLENTYYYYNVVCWLDRVLYAPPIIRKIFLEQLRKKMN